MRHNIRDSKGRFAKAQKALMVQIQTKSEITEELEQPDEELIEDSLLDSFLQVAAVPILAFLAGLLAVAILWIVKNL